MHEPTWGSFNTSHNSKTKEISWNDWWSRQCWFFFLKRAFFSSGSFVVHLWTQRSSDQDDHKGRSPTMRHVSRTHRVALDWLFDSSNLEPKIQIRYIDTKNQLADILTKGKFTRDEWNHLLCLFNISHFSSADCSEVMSKWKQKDAGEERVTAKFKPMMNLVSRCRVRDPTVLASTASESPGNTKSESQKVPLISLNVQLTGTVKPVTLASSSNSSEWNNDDKWVFSSAEIWWNVENEYGEDLYLTIWSSILIWTMLPPQQNRTFL